MQLNTTDLYAINLIYQSLCFDIEAKKSPKPSRGKESSLAKMGDINLLAKSIQSQNRGNFVLIYFQEDTIFTSFQGSDCLQNFFRNSMSEFAASPNDA